MAAIVDFALAAAGRGWKVFPLKPHSKRPITEHGQKDATDDVDQIRAWFSAGRDFNYGIACDVSGLYVVDVDAGPGKVGNETWRELMTQHKHVETFTVRTANGGQHFYYKMPDGVMLRNSASTKLGTDIDTRGNGYVVGPGSKLGSSSYQLEVNAEIAPLPDWIVERAKDALPRKMPAHLIESPHADEAEVLLHVAYLAAKLRDAPEGAGNDTAASIAYMCGGYVGAGQISEDAVVRILMDAIADWTYKHDDDFKTMNRTIDSQVHEGAKNPRPWHISRSFIPLELAEAEGDDLDEENRFEVYSQMWDNDIGQGLYLKRRLPQYIYVINIGWHAWDLTRWAPVSEGEIRAVVQSFYSDKFEWAVDRFKETRNEAWTKFAKKFKDFGSASRIGRIMNAWQHTSGVIRRAELMDSYPELLNTPTGVVNLRTGEITAHDPTLFITKITRGNYVPGFEHPDWTAAQVSLDAVVVDYLQLRYGQAATGYTPESDDMLMFTGQGSNGKSLMTTDGALRSLGDYGTLASPNLISIKGDSAGSAASPERAALHGQRFVLIEELPEGRSLNVAEIKRIIGTSKITARFLYQNDFSFDSSHTVFVTSNYLPTVNETDDGTWRRLCRIDFPYRFVDDPKMPNERVGDLRLKGRLKEGKTGQHDAIVTWIVEGARRYLAHPSLIMMNNRPHVIAEAVEDWRGMADRILAYIREHLVEDDNKCVAKSDLYADFSQWLATGGYGRWSQTTFFMRFKGHELTRNHRELRLSDRDRLSRPVGVGGTLFHSGYPDLPERPNVYDGYRFATRDDG